MIPVLILVHPMASKVEDAWNVLQWFAEQVQQHEPDVSVYRYWRFGEGEDAELVIYFQ